MKICNRCQSQNNDDALFCSECGFKFEEESAEIVKPKRNRIKSPTEDKKTSMIKSFSVGRRSTTIAIAITATVILVITCVAVVLASNQKNIKKEGSHLDKKQDSIATQESSNVTTEAVDSVAKGKVIFQTDSATETTSATAEKSTTSGQFLEATSDDIKYLNDNFIEGFCGYFSNYDSKDASLSDVANLMFHCCDKYGLHNPLLGYDDTIVIYYNTFRPDPKCLFGEQMLTGETEYSFYAINSDDFSKTVKNVFNYDIMVDDDFGYSDEYGNLLMYSYGDNVYAQYYGEQDGADYFGNKKLGNYKRLSDGKYEVYVHELYNRFEEKSGEIMLENAYKLTVGLKNIDGKRVWSIYKIDSSIS